MYDVRDKRGRILIHGSKKGKVALCRYEDLTEEEIQCLAETFCDLSKESDKSEVLSFLRFEEDSEKFCS